MRAVLILIEMILSSVVLAQADNRTIVKQFASATNDSIFISLNSKKPYQRFTVLNAYGMLSPVDSLILYTARQGYVIGPLNFENAIAYIKPVAIDSSIRMRVGNIWLNPEKRGAGSVDSLSENILKEVIKTGDFNAASKTYSDDANSNYDADLGWFFQGFMVPEFEQEVLKHKKGDYFIVTSRYGKHIVKVLDNPVRDRSKVEYVILFLDKK